MEDIKKTEIEFDNFMLEIGYSKVSNDVGFSPNFKNADYINKNKNIIVELKIIEKDYFEKGGFIDSTNSFISFPININKDGTGIYNFQFPNVNREGTLDNIEEPIRRTLKKANKQLKETKSYYYENSLSFGLVFILLVGLKSISAENLTPVIRKICNNEFSDIDGIVVCKPYKTEIVNTNFFRDTECFSITNETNLDKKTICLELAEDWVVFLEKGGHNCQ
ncbi:hypothetical protein [Flavobacterium celericrescens]|uniref:Uncharacterized protein n=1 Tax=Flavobacterium celericrescens TaxID=2709780 RepID=A0ABX0IBQ8_9FLAO|nr:hypothetical protein [Flavobacterium celericrescens]NHM03748.1 hypothetical protein [Flavobacterium celericrescens]